MEYVHNLSLSCIPDINEWNDLVPTQAIFDVLRVLRMIGSFKALDNSSNSTIPKNQLELSNIVSILCVISIIPFSVGNAHTKFKTIPSLKSLKAMCFIFQNNTEYAKKLYFHVLELLKSNSNTDDSQKVLYEILARTLVTSNFESSWLTSELQKLTSTLIKVKNKASKQEFLRFLPFWTEIGRKNAKLLASSFLTSLTKMLQAFSLNKVKSSLSDRKVYIDLLKSSRRLLESLKQEDNVFEPLEELIWNIFHELTSHPEIIKDTEYKNELIITSIKSIRSLAMKNPSKWWMQVYDCLRSILISTEPWNNLHKAAAISTMTDLILIMRDKNDNAFVKNFVKQLKSLLAEIESSKEFVHPVFVQRISNSIAYLCPSIELNDICTQMQKRQQLFATCLSRLRIQNPMITSVLFPSSGKLRIDPHLSIRICWKPDINPEDMNVIDESWHTKTQKSWLNPSFETVLETFNDLSKESLGKIIQLTETPELIKSTSIDSLKQLRETIEAQILKKVETGNQNGIIQISRQFLLRPSNIKLLTIYIIRYPGLLESPLFMFHLLQTVLNWAKPIVQSTLPTQENVSIPQQSKQLIENEANTTEENLSNLKKRKERMLSLLDADMEMQTAPKKPALVDSSADQDTDGYHEASNLLPESNSDSMQIDSPATEKNTEKRAKEVTKKAATAKKASKKKEPPKKPICHHWINHKCYKGNDCPFLHEGEQVTFDTICKFFRSGFCTKGAACPFSHNLKSEACNNMVQDHKCKYGDSCLYSHDEALVTKARSIREAKEREETDKKVQELQETLPFSNLITPLSGSEANMATQSSAEQANENPNNFQPDFVATSTLPPPETTSAITGMYIPPTISPLPAPAVFLPTIEASKIVVPVKPKPLSSE